KGGRISGKGTIKTSCLDFEKVSYVEELKFNLLSVSQICDKKHNVLFTDKECLILSPNLVKNLLRVIGTKWVFRNKRDERGTIIKNKARLVAQGYRQEEGVDYDEVFAPVARIEAIRLFLAFASFMGFLLLSIRWMSKVHFCMATLQKRVYVKQPLGFEDPAHPNKVYRVVKALYGLHQAPRARYERLSTFLLKHRYRRGAIDKTLFIKKDRRD
ncbi:putative ribonuclease H-like domain-containing protein, partial [Tanacetum coccineum]